MPIEQQEEENEGRISDFSRLKGLMSGRISGIIKSKVESQEESQKFHDRLVKKYSRMRRHEKKLNQFIEDHSVSERLQKILFIYEGKRLKLVEEEVGVSDEDEEEE